MMQEVYSALIEAGASEDKATAAATAIANYDNQLRELRSEVRELKNVITNLVTEVRVFAGIGVTIFLGIMWRTW